MSSSRPRKGLMYVAPALAERSAWLAEKQRVWLTLTPSPVRALTALSPSLVSGHFTTTLGAIWASSLPSLIIPSKSVATPLQFALIAPNLLAFTLIVLAGLVGRAAGAMNFSTIFVWLAWWGLLVLFLIPLAGRAWCAMCPIPAPGEWLARRAIVERSERPFGLGWAWPQRLPDPPP